MLTVFNSEYIIADIFIIIIMKSYTKYKKQTFKQSTPRDGRKQLTNRAPFNQVDFRVWGRVVSFSLGVRVEF